MTAPVNEREIAPEPHAQEPGQALAKTKEKEVNMSLEDLERRVQIMEDLEAIKKLHQNYIDLMDNLRYQEVLDLFTEDGEIEVRNYGKKKGRQEMSEVYLGVLGRRKERSEAHLAIEPDITVNGNTAKGTWLIYMIFSKPTIQWVQGRNETEYRKENGIWKISRLKFTRTNASDPKMFP